MDGAAIALARDNDLPVIVFSIEEAGNLLKVLRGEARATLIQAKKSYRASTRVFDRVHRWSPGGVSPSTGREGETWGRNLHPREGRLKWAKRNAIFRNV